MRVFPCGKRHEKCLERKPRPIRGLAGSHFLTMENIDREDLASLLKRIGGLHGTKAQNLSSASFENKMSAQA